MPRRRASLAAALLAVALAAVFGVLFLLPAAGCYLPHILAEALAFLPYGTMTQELAFNNAYTLFGFSVPVPLVRLGGYFLMTAVLLPLAARGWTKRQVS